MYVHCTSRWGEEQEELGNLKIGVEMLKKRERTKKIERSVKSKGNKTLKLKNETIVYYKVNLFYVHVNLFLTFRFIFGIGL